MNWFRHDIDAHDDIKIRKMQKVYGFLGLGIYWYLVEKIYQGDGCMSREEIIDELEMGGVDDADARETILDDFIEMGLLSESDGVVFCERIKEEMDFNVKARQKKVEAGRAGGLAKASNARKNVAMLESATEVVADASTSKQTVATSTTLPNLTLPNLNNNIEVSNDTSLLSPAENDGVNPPSVPRETVDYQGVVAMYNAICTSFPRVTKLSDGRKKAIRARVHYGYTMDDFKKVFESAQSSSFLKGNNKRNWSATFDWMINGENMAKVLDGNFNDKTPSDESQVRTNEVPVRKKDLSDITDEELEESKKVSWV